MVLGSEEAYLARCRELDAAEVETDRLLASIQAKALSREVRIQEARCDARARRGENPSESLRLTAHHEAGHAIASAVRGVRVTGCAVLGDASGICWLEATEENDVGHVAGAVAERLAGGHGARPSAADLALMRGSQHGVTAATFEAEELIARYWRQVERLAGALLAAGYVDGAVVHQIAGAPPPQVAA